MACAAGCFSRFPLFSNIEKSRTELQMAEEEEEEQELHPLFVHGLPASGAKNDVIRALAAIEAGREEAHPVSSQAPPSTAALPSSPLGLPSMETATVVEDDVDMGRRGAGGNARRHRSQARGQYATNSRRKAEVVRLKKEKKEKEEEAKAKAKHVAGMGSQLEAQPKVSYEEAELSMLMGIWKPVE